MSLILKQEPANTIATPPAGKTTMFVTDTNVLSTKGPDGTVTQFPTVQGSNTQVFFNDDGAINGDAGLVYNKTSDTMTVVNLSVTGTLNAGDISVSSIANGTSNVDIVGVSGNVTVSVTGVANVLTVTTTGANVAGTISASGNANVGNLGTAGLITATGNITGANLVTGGVLSVTGNANIGNIGTAGAVTATGNITGANLVTSGVLSVTGNANVGNIGATAGVFTTITGSLTTASQPNVTSTGTLTSVSVSGNANIGNIGTGGLITATGNITGGNIITAGVVSATGNANVGNLGTAGLITATGNIGGGNINTGGIVSATGNITTSANLIAATGYVSVANGLYSTNTYGGSYTDGIVVDYSTGNGRLTTGSADGLLIRNNGISSPTTILGIDANGNVTTSGTVSATGNATFGNVSATAYTGTTVSVSGNANVGNIGTGGLITATGNLNAGNLITGGVISATGNATVGNLVTAGVVTATGNVTGGNVTTTGIVSATGGATFVGNVVMSSKNITSLADPVNPQDGATKNYVDSVAQGLDVKASVIAATTGTLATATSGTVSYNNGTAGVGATLTTTGTFTTIDGASIATVGSRVLVKNEANAAWNGIYTYTSSTVITRSTDFDAAAEIPSAFVFVEDGSTQADTGWVCTTNSPITVGTTNITFSQFSGAGTYSAGTGLTLTGTTFSVNASQTQITATGTLTTLSVSGNANIGNIGTAGIVVSSIATGTAPLTVTSTTRVANLNVAYSNVSDYLGTGSALNGNFYLTMQNALSGNVQALGNTAFIANASNGALYATTFIGALSGAATTAGTVTTNAQPNITSTGTLASLSVSGNANIGNIGTAGLITATGNIGGGNINTAGIVSATGNIIGGSKLLVGTGSSGLTNPVGVFQGSGATYTQLAMFNSTGTGSADLVAYGNNGDDTQSWADIGFTGNTFNDANYTVTGAGDGYFFTQGNASFGGNMIIATGAVGTTKDIIFATGGFLTANIKARLYNANGTFNVTGNVNGGNVTTGGIVAATGNVTGANIVASAYTISSVATGISAAGTVQGNATVITKDINVVSTVTAGQGVVLPTAIAGMRITVLNTSAAALLVYPAVNGIINALSANAAYSAPAGSKLDFVSTTTTQWYTLNATYN